MQDLNSSVSIYNKTSSERKKVVHTFLALIACKTSDKDVRQAFLEAYITRNDNSFYASY